MATKQQTQAIESMNLEELTNAYSALDLRLSRRLQAKTRAQLEASRAAIQDAIAAWQGLQRGELSLEDQEAGAGAGAGAVAVAEAVAPEMQDTPAPPETDYAALNAQLKTMLAAEDPYPSSIGSQAIYAAIDAAAEAGVPVMPAGAETAWHAEVAFLQQLVAQGTEAIRAALEARQLKVRLPGTAPVRTTPKAGGTVLKQISPEIQAQMRADRAAGLSYVKIDLKHGYPVKTNGRMAYTVCKAAVLA
jgi:hypothetical protein